MRFLITTVRLATPIIFAAIGTFLAASSGIANIAIESIMTFAALAGVLGSYLSGSPWVGVLAGMDFLLICTYGRDGADPELLLYKKR